MKAIDEHFQKQFYEFQKNLKTFHSNRVLNC